MTRIRRSLLLAFLIGASGCSSAGQGGESGLAPEKTAPEVFRSFENSIRDAKTVRIKFKSSVEGQGQKAEAEGLLLLKEGDRVFFEIKGTFQGKPAEGVLISDGESMISKQDGKVTRRKTPKNLTSFMAVGAGRWMVCYLPKLLNEYGKEGDAAAPRLETLLEMREVHAVNDETGAKSLAYEVILRGLNDVSSEVVLTVNPKNSEPVRRTLDFANKFAFFRETYEEFQLGLEIPDEKFALPPGK